MAWWRLGSVFLVAVAAAAFVTAESEIWESVDTFPDLELEDKDMSGKWESVPELQDEAVSGKWESVPELQDGAVSGKWVDLYDSKDRRQASDYYDEDDYSDGIAQVGEEYSIKNALKPRSGKQKCPFTPAPEDESTTPQTVTAVPLPPVLPIGVLPPRPMMPPRPPVLPIGVLPPLPPVLPPRPPVLPPRPPVLPPRPMMPPRPPGLPPRPMMPPRPPVLPIGVLPQPPVRPIGVLPQPPVWPIGVLPQPPVWPIGVLPQPPVWPIGVLPQPPVRPIGVLPQPPVRPIGVLPQPPVRPIGVLPQPPVRPIGVLPQPPVRPIGVLPQPPVRPIGVLPQPPVLPIGVLPQPPVLPPQPPVRPPRPMMPPRPPVLPIGVLPTGVLPPRPMMPPRPPASFPPHFPPVPHTPPVSSTGVQNCVVSPDQRLTCGSVTINHTACLAAGCCFDSTCFYPMNECTKDEHFVFAINRDAPKRHSVDPTGLVIPSDQACRPVIVAENGTYAIFKFSIHECGTHYYQVGGTNVYLAEVFTPITTMSLKYGIITRSKFVRFLFECRYDVGGPVSHTSLFSIGYMVKTPFSSFPSQIISDGLFAIQLRIAREANFTSWVDDHLPLRELVNGEPVYLEVRLRSPKPKAVLLVNYCVAYTRYATNALVIIYEGCENPLDDTVAILRVTEANRYTRRFKVDAFQFIDLRTSKFINEDIYFMCSTELCMPLERQCEERCFDGQQRPLLLNQSG